MFLAVKLYAPFRVNDGINLKRLVQVFKLKSIFVWEMFLHILQRKLNCSACQEKVSKTQKINSINNL